MFCTNCGEEIQPNGILCPLCNFDLTHVIALLDEPDEDDFDLEDEVRSAEEIARRALCLAAVISCAYGDSKETVSLWLKSEQLWEHLSLKEKNFLENESDQKTDAQYTWKIEALIPMLWAIKKIPSMPGLKSECNTELLKKAVIWSPNSTKEYISSSVIRDEEEINSEYEKVYQAHWKVRDREINGKAPLKSLNSGVVYERHYSFNWVIGYMGQGWDDISTDT